jgi:cell division protein ZapA
VATARLQSRLRADYDWRTMAAHQPSPQREPNVRVDIYDQSYSINSGENGENEEYVKELAAYVDAKMREIADSTRMVDSLKVAVLAALNISDELLTLRRRQKDLEGPLRQRVEKCVAMVERALEQSN